MHERLAIVDPAGGSQPLRSADGELVLAVNGEIYNHRELKQALAQPYEFLTGSDCEVINALYRQRDDIAGSARRSSTASSPSRCGIAVATASSSRAIRSACARCTGGTIATAACASPRR